LNFNNITENSVINSVKLTQKDKEVTEQVLSALEKLIYKIIHTKFLKDKVRKEATVYDAYQYVATRLSYIIGKHHFGETLSYEDTLKICKTEINFSINDWLTLNTKQTKYHVSVDFQKASHDHDENEFDATNKAVQTAISLLSSKKDQFTDIEIKIDLDKNEKILYEYYVEGGLFNFTAIKNIAFSFMKTKEYENLIKSFRSKLKKIYLEMI